MQLHLLILCKWTWLHCWSNSQELASLFSCNFLLKFYQRNLCRIWVLFSVQQLSNCTFRLIRLQFHEKRTKWELCQICWFIFLKGLRCLQLDSLETWCFLFKDWEKSRCHNLYSTSFRESCLKQVMNLEEFLSHVQLMQKIQSVADSTSLLFPSL